MVWFILRSTSCALLLFPPKMPLKKPVIFPARPPEAACCNAVKSVPEEEATPKISATDAAALMMLLAVPLDCWVISPVMVPILEPPTVILLMLTVLEFHAIPTLGKETLAGVKLG